MPADWFRGKMEHNKSLQLTPWVPTPSGRVSGNSTQHLVDAAGQLNSMLGPVQTRKRCQRRRCMFVAQATNNRALTIFYCQETHGRASPWTVEGQPA